MPEDHGGREGADAGEGWESPGRGGGGFGGEMVRSHWGHPAGWGWGKAILGEIKGVQVYASGRHACSQMGPMGRMGPMIGRRHGAACLRDWPEIAGPEKRPRGR